MIFAIYSSINIDYFLKGNTFQTSKQIQKKMHPPLTRCSRSGPKKNTYTLKLDTKLQLNQAYYDGTKRILSNLVGNNITMPLHPIKPDLKAKRIPYTKHIIFALKNGSSTRRNYKQMVSQTCRQSSTVTSNF